MATQRIEKRAAGWVLVLAGFLVGVPWAYGVAKERMAGPVPAQVLRVIDGDTLEVRARVWLGQDVTVAVRVSGVDTPETKHRAQCLSEQALGDKASRFVRDLFADTKAIALRNIEHGRNGGRVAARIFLPDGRALDTVLIDADLGRPHKGAEGRQPWCTPEEIAEYKAAKKARRDNR